MRWRLRHTTTYTYDDVVGDSLGLAHLVPRELPWQQVGSYDVHVTPAPADTAQETDHFGNLVTYFQVLEPHRELVVEGRGEVTVSDHAPAVEALGRPWESLRPLHPDTGSPGAPPGWQTVDVTLPSPLVPADAGATAYAAACFPAGRAVGEAVTELMHRVHADFAYDPTATTVTSTVPEILERRAGVCQDFAHLLLACLRGHGLAARYVSGYLATEPPPGRARVVGADASHAWVEVWLGEQEWLAIDPTNDQWVGERHVTVARGRDYGDVPPLKGVIFTEAERSTMQVSVDVAPIG